MRFGEQNCKMLRSVWYTHTLSYRSFPFHSYKKSNFSALFSVKTLCSFKIKTNVAVWRENISEIFQPVQKDKQIQKRASKTTRWVIFNDAHTLFTKIDQKWKNISPPASYTPKIRNHNKFKTKMKSHFLHFPKKFQIEKWFLAGPEILFSHRLFELESCWVALDHVTQCYSFVSAFSRWELELIQSRPQVQITRVWPHPAHFPCKLVLFRLYRFVKVPQIRQNVGGSPGNLACFGASFFGRQFWPGQPELGKWRLYSAESPAT